MKIYHDIPHKLNIKVYQIYPSNCLNMFKCVFLFEGYIDMDQTIQLQYPQWNILNRWVYLKADRTRPTLPDNNMNLEVCGTVVLSHPDIIVGFIFPFLMVTLRCYRLSPSFTRDLHHFPGMSCFSSRFYASKLGKERFFIIGEIDPSEPFGC